MNKISINTLLWTFLLYIIIYINHITNVIYEYIKHKISQNKFIASTLRYFACFKNETQDIQNNFHPQVSFNISQNLVLFRIK